MTNGEQVQRAAHNLSEEYAKDLDAQDPLGKLRDEFIIPSMADLKRKKLARGNFECQSTSRPEKLTVYCSDPDSERESQSCTYLCGNSLGLQPRRTAEYVGKFLDTWATQGVYGHFKELEDAACPPWVHSDDIASENMAWIVGALPSEVAVMETLTVNLHLLMASFYRPTKDRYKIIIEGKAFPSDHVGAPFRNHRKIRFL